MIDFATIIQSPWLVCGDFNDVLSTNEKWGVQNASVSRIRDFSNCINSCNLTDLGYSGPKFTWCNKRPDGHVVLQRLDRFLGNLEWINLFLDAINYHLPRIKSDHNLILLINLSLESCLIMFGVPTLMSLYPLNWSCLNLRPFT